ncbi:diguanylate cyclase domain-containing protein [Comamonas sp. J-3]|uniref:sensor domain-containing diguanylate cyclase n=1 Tax=Comamonas trifloxystrobinivorans TaxID=3350256 RepID=UPI003726D184
MVRNSLSSSLAPGAEPHRALPGPWAWQLLLVVPLLVLLAAGLSAWLVMRANQGAALEQLRSQQAEETELLAKLIGSKLEQSQKVLSTVAEAAAPWALDSQPTLEWLLDQGLSATRYFDSLVFARDSQVFRLNFRTGSEAATQADPAERDLLRRVIVDGKPQVSDPFKSTQGGPSIALGMPLRNKDGSVQGAMAGVLRLQSQSLLPLSLAVSAQAHSQLVVLSTSGLVISHPEPTRILGLAQDEATLAQAMRLWAERPAGSVAGSVQAWWRAPHLISVAEIPSARWLVVRVVERSAMPWWHGWERGAWWALAAPWLLALAAGLWLWQHTRKLRLLAEQAALLDGPNGSQAAQARGDELDQLGLHLQNLQQHQQQLQGLLAQQTQLSDAVLEQARFSLMLLKGERIVLVSQALAHLLGYSRADLQDQSVQLLARQEGDLAALWSQVEPDLQRHGSAEASVMLHHQSGSPLMVTVQLVRVSGVAPDYLWCFVRAGQARVAASRVSAVDQLTQLPNFDGLHRHLMAMLQAQREGLDGSSPSAPVLFYVNVDNMSSINALAGHAQGDSVLQQVARQLQLLQPFQGFAARVAGDKFALVLRQCSRHKAQELAQQLCEALQNWQPELRGKHFMVTVSIGLLQIEAAWGEAQHIIRAADLACYAAKRQGGNCWRWADEAADAEPRRREHG